MREVDLKKLDLNLLVALEALLQEQSVTRAAKRLGRSQPAMSRALGRLRQSFGDPLMVGVGRGLELTPRAIELEEQVARVLSDVRGLFECTEFDPTTALMEFKISAPEGAIYLLLADFLVNATKKAPHIKFSIESVAARQLDALQSGEIDLAVDTFVDAPAGYNRQSLIQGELVCVVRKDHPAVKQEFDVNAFVKWPHIWIDSANSRALDVELDRKGIFRECPVRITSFLVGSTIAQRTDNLMVLPKPVAALACKLAPLAILPLPISLPQLSLHQLWHPRRNHDPAHIWIRSMIFETARTVEMRSELVKK